MKGIDLRQRLLFTEVVCTSSIESLARLPGLRSNDEQDIEKIWDIQAIMKLWRILLATSLFNGLCKQILYGIHVWFDSIVNKSITNSSLAIGQREDAGMIIIEGIEEVPSEIYRLCINSRPRFTEHVYIVQNVSNNARKNITSSYQIKYAVPDSTEKL